MPHKDHKPITRVPWITEQRIRDIKRHFKYFDKVKLITPDGEYDYLSCNDVHAGDTLYLHGIKVNKDE